LLDTSARAAYDRLLTAKKAAELRHKQLDGKRQKLKSDLEERERLAQATATIRGYKANKTPEELFKDEMDRLRKEGSRLLEEEQELMRKQLQEDALLLRQSTGGASGWDSAKHRIKIKWKADKGDTKNGGYSEEVLRKYLNKYGDIVALVLSPKKMGSGLVEFSTLTASEMAIAYEKGNLDNPLLLEWIGEAPQKSKKAGRSSTVTDADFESLVLRQLRQAEERKKLIEQMMRDEENEK
jgi:DnaJ homolog subfamily C member 17